jgi:hypothetical protein
MHLTSERNAKRFKTMTATRVNSLDRADGRIFMPRRFNKRCRQRFSTDRQRRWQAHAGRTDPQAATLIKQLIALEWDVLRLEARENEKGKLSAHDRIALATWRRHFREALRQLGSLAAAAPASRSMADLRRQAREAAGAPVRMAETLTITPADAYKAMIEGRPAPGADQHQPSGAVRRQGFYETTG